MGYRRSESGDYASAYSVAGSIYSAAGEGSAKSGGKEFVVILDFIGNYKNNFMIPIALSGDRTYNKDNIRRYMLEGGR